VKQVNPILVMSLPRNMTYRGYSELLETPAFWEGIQGALHVILVT
jgi:hypothetical protein